MRSNINLDKIDHQILRELQADGRLSNKNLADRVGLSATPCWNRVRALEETGVIEGYAAVLNLSALGTPDTVIVEVTLSHHDDATLNRFSNALSVWPDVIEAYLVTGDFDYLLKVAVAGTSGHEAFLRRLHAFVGLQKSRSVFTLRRLGRPPTLSGDAKINPV